MIKLCMAMASIANCVFSNSYTSIYKQVLLVTTVVDGWRVMGCSFSRCKTAQIWLLRNPEMEMIYAKNGAPHHTCRDLDWCDDPLINFSMSHWWFRHELWRKKSSQGLSTTNSYTDGWNTTEVAWLYPKGIQNHADLRKFQMSQGITVYQRFLRAIFDLVPWAAEWWLPTQCPNLPYHLERVMKMQWHAYRRPLWKKTPGALGDSRGWISWAHLGQKINTTVNGLF